ncbi:unnamed protein product [Onchocerca flexuosa]|uniref:Uncharacterized protein n=1 Tax=Onchocerca flexuosa TaxID=387005 RepID=A0A183HC89_9BILA|nr:unnamed protein product [Onchocerca flexuosa]
MSDLRQWTAILSGASLSKFSIRRMVKSRELGRREKLISHHASFVPNTSGAFTLDEKANLVNSVRLPTPKLEEYDICNEDYGNKLFL